MSLFKARDWWSTNCGTDEQFDNGCMCIANINNSSDGLDKLIVGSFSGILRIYAPHASLQDEGSVDAPRLDSLLIEAQLSAPVLQVQAGRFVSSSDSIHLAILHPRKLAIYGVSEIPGNVELGFHYHLGLMYEHKLERSAFRFVIGPFGKVKGREFICILSLDGTVSFFEQESFAFSRFLPNALLPGPFAYVDRTDSFVTVSSCYHLESYKYQVLAVASSSASSKDSTENMKFGKKVMMDWDFNLGEPAIDIAVITPKNCTPLIYVLGERHLFCMKDSGSPRFTKKLEFQPSCFHVYAHGIDGSVFCMIATFTGILMVYQDMCLRWASQMSFVPIHMSRVNLRGLKGAIVALSEDGELVCSYLGTNPTVYMPPTIESREINYAESDKELSELYKIIKTSQKSGGPVSRHQESVLSVSVEVSHELEPPSGDSSEKSQAFPSISLQILLKAALPLENIQLTCHFDKCFSVSQTVFYFPTINDTVNASIDVSLREGFVPSTLFGKIVAIYSNVLGAVSVVQSSVMLPAKLCMTSCTPQKDADFKITISTNKSAVKLNDLFPDFVTSGSSNTSQALGFQFYGGPMITLLVAKTSQRYRLQCDNFGAMSLLTTELISRLQKWFSNSTKGGKLVCSYSNTLPLQEFYFVVNKHLQARHKELAYEKRLSQLASQFRVIQKRLLTKFKDKTPVSINSLDVLMETTYRQILSTSDALENHHQVMEISLCNINAAARLFVTLLKLSGNIPELQLEVLEQAMCPPLQDENEQGWEELVCTNLGHLLKTVFCKPSQETLTQNYEMSMPDDIGVLKKRISAVIDFISKVSLREENEDETSKKTDSVKSLTAEKESTSEHDEQIIPLGSQFGEKQRSARQHLFSQIQDQTAEELHKPIEPLHNHTAEGDQLPTHLPSKHSQHVNLFEDVVDKIPDIHSVSFDATNTVEEF